MVKAQLKNGITPCLVISEHSWPWGFPHPNTDFASVDFFSPMALKNQAKPQILLSNLDLKKAEKP